MIHVRKKPQGFTLVELLVVIAIIAVLIALLLPAIQKVRESANRVKCLNNIKQLALGVLLYYDTEGHFPAQAEFPIWTRQPTSLNGCDPAGGNNAGMPWALAICPYIEDGNRYQRLQTVHRGVPQGDYYALWAGAGTRQNGSGFIGDETNKAVQLERNTKFECPSDPNSNDNNANSNYFAVEGGGTDPSTWCLSTPDSPFESSRYNYYNGIMYDNSRTQFRDVKDGTSNTFLLGETRYLSLIGGGKGVEQGGPINGNDCTFGFYGTWASTWYSGGGRMPVTAAAARDPINSSPANPNRNCTFEVQTHMFGSHHVGGCSFAFADGHVGFIRESINLATYQSLGGRADGGPSSDWED